MPTDVQQLVKTDTLHIVMGFTPGTQLRAELYVCADLRPEGMAAWTPESNPHTDPQTGPGYSAAVVIDQPFTVEMVRAMLTQEFVDKLGADLRSILKARLLSR
jgi:hypothetical protein